jgi:hypothetical protein
MKKVFDYNADGVVNTDDIFDLITDLMKNESKKKVMGEQKKMNVLQHLKNILPSEVYDRFNPMFDKFIDFIYGLSQNTKVLKHFKKNCTAFPCCK